MPAHSHPIVVGVVPVRRLVVGTVGEPGVGAAALRPELAQEGGVRAPRHPAQHDEVRPDQVALVRDGRGDRLGVS